MPGVAPAVKVAMAFPDAVVLMVGLIAPKVAVNETGIPSGTWPSAEVSMPLLFLVRSATTVATPPGRRGVGEAVRWRISQRLSVTGPPLTVSLPAPFGPALLPHQLLMASTVFAVVLFSPTELPTMRLKLAVNIAIAAPPLWFDRLMPSPLPVMLLLVRVP